jgi:hypothetical protein
MTELLIVGMFTAFFLAVLKPFINLLAILGGGLVINASFALVIASLPVYILIPENIPALVVWAIAGGFLGSFLLTIAERVATHRPAVINTTRPE